MATPLTGGAVVSALIGSRLLRSHRDHSNRICFRARGWARAIATIVALLPGLYCLSFLAMAGWEFGTVAYAAQLDRHRVCGIYINCDSGYSDLHDHPA